MTTTLEEEIERLRAENADWKTSDNARRLEVERLSRALSREIESGVRLRRENVALRLAALPRDARIKKPPALVGVLRFGTFGWEPNESLDSEWCDSMSFEERPFWLPMPPDPSEVRP